MNESLRTPGLLVSFLFWGLLLLGLFLTSRYSYLLFHSIAGFFSVIIATGVFAIAWNSRRFQENNYLLFLGIAYLFVGALDLLYTLAFQGLEFFPGFSQQLPTHLWFAARTLESISLFLAPQFIGRRLRPYAVFSGYLLVFTAIILVIFIWRLLPLPLAASGPELIALKKTGKYVNSIVLVGAMALLWRQREEFDPGVLGMLLGAIVAAIGSEAALTFLAKTSPQAGLLGHVLKVVSFYLIYRALIATEIIKPYRRLFNNLRHSGEVLRQEKDFADRLMEMAQVIVLVLDREGRILRLNRMCEAITGYALADVKNRPFWEVFPAPEEMEEVQEAFFDLLAGDFYQSWQIDWVARDGTRRLIAWANTAFPRDDGAVDYVIGTGIDITEQREFEKRLHRLNGKLEKQIQGEPQLFRQFQVTHQGPDEGTVPAPSDFLGVSVRWLRGYCRALKEHSARRLDVKGQVYLRQMQGTIRQMEEHLEAVQEGYRVARTEMLWEEIDLSFQARLIAEDLKRTGPERRVEFIIEPGLTAMGDPIRLRAVIKNLLGNAWKFTREVPRVRIEFGVRPGNNSHQQFYIRDNRTDFGKNYSNKLFRYFQSFHIARDFSGSDISLATVRSLILQHGGRIWGEGRVGEGVTFYFTLSKSPAEPARKINQRESQTFRAG
ncbi:MAG: MASE3 domain-containing protein [Thermodesulfobacteriota bacterium]